MKLSANGANEIYGSANPTARVFKGMHRLFQNFIDGIAESTGVDELRQCMSDTASALHLDCFAYLVLPGSNSDLRHITTYPHAWTSHYLHSRYERLDPILFRALGDPEPFGWSHQATVGLSEPQRQLFDEAARFGIRHGFTVPIHDGRGPIAAVTFACDESRASAFRRHVQEQRRLLQLMAIYFHAHARRKLFRSRVIDGISLSSREFECLEWSVQGKTAWEIGKILGISRHTVATHLENAKSKLGVRTIVQAAARLASVKLATWDGHLP